MNSAVKKATAVLVIVGLVCLSQIMTSKPLFSADAAVSALHVGIFPRRSAAKTVTMFTPLMAYLEERLGLAVTLTSGKDFKSFWQGVETQRFDLVHFNQLHYLQAHDAFGYQAIGANQEFHRKTLSGAIYVRKDSGIERLEDLRGKKIVFGGGQSAMMSYIVPRFMLEKAGLKPGDYEAAYAITPINAVFAPYFHQSDAAAAGDVMLDLPSIRARINPDALKILAKSEPIFQLPWAVKGDMPDDIREKLLHAFLALNDSARGKDILKQAGMTGFSKASHDHYQTHRAIIDAVQGR